MTTYTQPKTLSDVLINQGQLQQIVLAPADTALDIGTVMTHDNDYQFRSLNADDNFAYVILAEPVQPSKQPQHALAIVGNATVRLSELILPESMQQQKVQSIFGILQNTANIMTEQHYVMMHGLSNQESVATLSHTDL